MGIWSPAQWLDSLCLLFCVLFLYASRWVYHPWDASNLTGGMAYACTIEASKASLCIMLAISQPVCNHIKSSHDQAVMRDKSLHAVRSTDSHQKRNLLHFLSKSCTCAVHCTVHAQANNARTRTLLQHQCFEHALYTRCCDLLLQHNRQKYW